MNELNLIKLNIYEAYDNGEITYGEKEYLLEQVNYAYEDVFQSEGFKQLIRNGRNEAMKKTGSHMTISQLASLPDEDEDDDAKHKKAVKESTFDTLLESINDLYYDEF